MAKAKTNYLIDVITLIAFIVTAVTGVVLFFIPSGNRSGYTEVFGVIKQVWSEWHQWFGIVMIALALIHFLLHWNWFVCMTRNIFRKKGNK